MVFRDPFSLCLSLVGLVVVGGDLIDRHFDRPDQQQIADIAVAEFAGRPGLWIVPDGASIPRPTNCPPGTSPDLALTAIPPRVAGEPAKILGVASCKGRRDDHKDTPT